MIRTVADRIASSTRPSYRGRHRAKPGKPATAPRTPPPEAEQAERDRRPEAEEFAGTACGPAEPRL